MMFISDATMPRRGTLFVHNSAHGAAPQSLRNVGRMLRRPTVAYILLAALAQGCSGSSADPATDGGPAPADGAAADGQDGGSAEGGDEAPASQRVRAAAATATTTAACTAITPFYWEIGDKTTALGSGSLKGSSTTTYTATSEMPIASASKWLYSTYWVQRTNGVLSATDIQFFNFWSGYTNFTSCIGSTTVGNCLDLVNKDGTTNGTLDPATENKFAYGGGHMQKHAALNGLAALDTKALATEIGSQLGTDIKVAYGHAQLAGGANMSAAEYAKMLRKIIGGQMTMRSVLGTHPVCVDPASCPEALSTPSAEGEKWHYSIGHWVEDDPTVGDGAFSSPGAFGFYPWIDQSTTFYGIIARVNATGAISSVKCGRLIRKAFVTGVAQ